MKKFKQFAARTLLMAVTLLAAQGATAQSKTVKGKVTDGSHEPLIGVSVTIKGTNNTGVITDVNGNYSITVPNEKSVLLFNYIGFSEAEQNVGNKSTVNVEMKEDNIGLDEVVVIGYGSVKRKDLTGAVASVKGDDLAAVPVNNVAQALQGKLAGVNVISGDGRPDADVTIRVRGGGSITQSNDPLFIVDGFPVSTISNIPASEIESIDVLKDASSTAIYGARGANGVILVTTKKAEGGKVKVSYDGYVQAKSVAKTLETLSAQDYVLFHWGYGTSRGKGVGDAVAKYFGLGSAYGNHYAQYANMSTHDYTDDLLRTAWTHSHNVAVSGGTDKTHFVANVNYINDKGIKIRSGLEKFSASLKLQQQLLSNLTLDFDLRYTEASKQGQEGLQNGRGTEISGAYKYRPIDNPLGGVSVSEISGLSFGVKNIDDSYHANPLLLVESVTNESVSRNLRGSSALSWEIVNGLTARTEISISRSSGTSKYYDNGYNDAAEKRATLSRSTGTGLRWLNTLNYNLALGKNHSLNFLLGHELITNNSESTQLSGYGYPNNFDYDTAIGMINTATRSFSAINSIAVPTRTVSYFGRANYSLLDRYLFTVTMRADGSSKFAPNNRWGYFPAAAFGWRISEEPFMAGTKDWLSNLKLRLSYGTSGADNISPNLWRETWKTTSAANNKVTINGEKTPFYQPDGLLANNDLKWETTISRNLGIDYGFLDGRINGSIELYWNTTKDLLMLVPIDNTTGYTYQYQNFGKTSNRGFELSANVDIIRTKDLRFNVGVIYNYNKNKVDELTNADNYLYSSYWASSALMPVNDYMLVEGKSVGIVRGFKSKGFYTVDDFNYVNGQYILKEGVADFDRSISANYMNPFNLPQGQSAFPGAAKFEDVDGNGRVTLDDATELGEVMPHHTGGFSMNLQYKNWDASANFNYVLDGKIYNANAMMNLSGGEYNDLTAQKLAFISEAYKIYNVNSSGELYAVTDPTELTSLNAGAKYAVPYHQNGIVTDEFLESGAYLRLQTLTIGYTLPKTILKKISISNLRLYLTASNLFTITGYSGVDPEVNASTTGRTGFLESVKVLPTLNMDWGAYPRARTFTFGANINF
ncbi:SusC/RagA family TonB-linked outer membrane protein [Xylanibacter ruminicola]|uniref:TonB-linked outer membrane protein, SusC/RagA family n=1 Tax=Xylanibacter ruminicola TaxID=839 RepID=A0A1M6TXV8_XYLRU|nr:TonB-dependent receptor [Xylanibacter ruminicola]SHK61769.1 TonB-linked outer membrane protein, SusC/RagA family [Xylanibacter ruminicola]